MAGYSKTPLHKKLGLKDKTKAIFLDCPEYYKSLFEAWPSVIEQQLNKGSVDFIHYFTKSKEELSTTFPLLKNNLNKTGILWISWPKKSAKVQTDLDGNIVRSLGLETGLVDVKVCAIDDTWSGLKFVYRKKDR